MNAEEREIVLKRGHANNEEEWWFLVDHHWNDLHSIINRFAGSYSAGALKAKADRNKHKLYSIFNEAWFDAPDSPTLHSIPGWGIMCDLCSEFPFEESEVRKVGMK